MDRSRALGMLIVCAATLLVFLGVSYALTCQLVSHQTVFPASDGTVGCNIITAPNLACPAKTTLTGGGCACDSCMSLVNSFPKIKDKIPIWGCDYLPSDVANVCQQATVTVRALCCK